MKKTMVVALAIALSAGASAALAEAGPDLGKPFGGGRVYTSPSVAATGNGGPVASDTDARARLQADGYRAVDGLVRGTDGAWHGTAIRGSAKVNVTVVPDGRVIAR